MNKESVARWIELPDHECCVRLVPFKLFKRFAPHFCAIKAAAYEVTVPCDMLLSFEAI